MMMAAALVNPMITGCDRKFTTTPRRSSPRLSWNRPTINDRATA